VISGAVAIVPKTTLASENAIDNTKMPVPSPQSKDGVRVDNVAAPPTGTTGIPASEEKVITLTWDAADDRYENSALVTLRGVSGWGFIVDNYTVATYDDLYVYNPITGAWSPDPTPAIPPDAAGYPIGSSFAADNSFEVDNFVFWHRAILTAAENSVCLRVHTWMVLVGDNAFRVDLDNDGAIGGTDNLMVVIADNNSDGLMDRVYLSANSAFDNGVGNDSVVTATGDNDENMVLADNQWSAGITIGNRYKFRVKIRENAPVSGVIDDVSIIIDNYYTGTLSVDVTGDGAVDALNFCLVDDNSDGIFENLYISAIDDNFLEPGLLDDNVSSGNDEKITITENIRIGIYQYLIQGPNAPGQSDDISISSLSRWFGHIYLDTDGDENADNIVYVCLSDNDSNGVFDVMEISSDDNTFGESSTTDSAYTDNDARLTAAGYVRIGENAAQSYRYLVEFDNSPEGTGYDFRVTSRSWYIGTVTLHADENFDFVIWDPDSDGVFENLVFDDNRDNSYSGDQQYDTDNTYPIYLPRGTQYGYRLVWFSRSPAYTDATYGDNDLVIQPVDVASPAFSNPSPAPWVAVSDRTPTVSIELEDVGSEGVTFGIDPRTIIMRVRGDVVSHTYSAGVLSWEGQLYDGTVEVRVEARDYAENPITITEWRFIVDTAEPVITITSPPSPLYASSSPEILVTGTITDLTWATVTVQGKEVVVMDGMFREWVTLNVGKNTITVRAIDQAGNMATSELTVTYEPELAAPPPPEEFPTEQVTFIAAGGIVAIIALIAVFVKRP
jgi:hypothetical protein